eukprot:GFUD01017615.1.p1 GENE.GFUD01017615.1~~GFUD01017615.1.p1  ORF type:complete len:624 (+),score=164.39 GFUD01017615.1:135-2006(+)
MAMAKSILTKTLHQRAYKCNSPVLARFLHDDSKKVRIGCSSGFWGDTPTAVPQLLYGGNIQYLVCDYLSEITMSLLAAAKTKNPQLGFTPDFVESIAPHLGEIKKQGIRIVTNGGGINPKACVAMLQALSKKAGVEFSIADVSGDDLMGQRDALTDVKEMFSGKPFPGNVNSMNAYYGAGPILNALDRGAEIVVTGRATDSALALAPLMHEFGWKPSEFDKLAAGSLAGHLIECGAQVTGGNHTDWEMVEGFDNMGFPIAEVSSSGEMLITKPPGTGGMVTVGTVAEQLLYEIGDGQSYHLPDVIADFSQVKMLETNDGVLVKGALGRAPTDTYKISATYLDGFKGTCVINVGGGKAAKKSQVIADATFKRTKTIFAKLGIPDFEKTHVQILGSEQSIGKHALPEHMLPREAVLWMSVKHKDRKAIQVWAKEIAASGTGGTPGLTAFVGGRPKPTPCLKLYSFLYPKSNMDATVTLDGKEETYKCGSYPEETIPKIEVEEPELLRGTNSIRLEDLAFTRSGDKGNSCNIGVIARDPAFLPYIREQITVEAVTDYFQHVFESTPVVRRYDLPGVDALNFVLEASLGGGGIASLRPDPQGKAYGQILSDFVLTNMPTMEDIKSTV